MKTTTNETAGLKSLAHNHRNFASRSIAAEKTLGVSGSEVRELSAEDFAAAGFTADEAAALVFIFASEAEDFDAADRWIHAHKSAIALL